MFTRTWLALGLAVMVASVASAASPAVDVTAELNNSVIGIGETATLTVYAQIKQGLANPNNGIFGWNVDLRASDPSVISALLPGNIVLNPTWTNNPLTSSNGTAEANGINAIYNTGEATTSIGVGGRIELFSISFQGLSAGTTTLSIQPDFTTGSDFVTWMGDMGGDFSAASANLTVVPEPATMSLLALSGLGILARRRRS